MLTEKGIKPISRFQKVFQSTYLFGAFSPLDGQDFMLNLPYCNAYCFQLFLDEFSQQNPSELKIMLLDNGAFHKAKALVIPKNIALIFLPPYSPELNPAEKICQKMKRNFTNKLFNSIEQLQEFICNECNSLSKNEVISICSYNYIFQSDFWSHIY